MSSLVSPGTEKTPGTSCPTAAPSRWTLKSVSGWHQLLLLQQLLRMRRLAKAWSRNLLKPRSDEKKNCFLHLPLLCTQPGSLKGKPLKERKSGPSSFNTSCPLKPTLRPSLLWRRRHRARLRSSYSWLVSSTAVSNGPCELQVLHVASRYQLI